MRARTRSISRSRTARCMERRGRTGASLPPRGRHGSGGRRIKTWCRRGCKRNPNSSTRQQWMRDKKINILVQMGMKPHADIAGVPMAIDLAKTPDDKRVMEVVFAKFGMSRPFMAPPDLPVERLATLRGAFDATLKDE